jgi:hypothetical protein
MKNLTKTVICVLVTVVTFSVHEENDETKKSAGFETGFYQSKAGGVNSI